MIEYQEQYSSKQYSRLKRHSLYMQTTVYDNYMLGFFKGKLASVCYACTHL